MKFSLCRLVMCGGYSRLSSPVPCCPECTDQGHYVKGDKMVSVFILLLDLVLVLIHPLLLREPDRNLHTWPPWPSNWHLLLGSVALNCTALNCTAPNCT